MNSSMRLSIAFFFILLILSMSACSTNPQVTTALPALTITPTQTVTSLPSFTPFPATPTYTPIPIPTDLIPASSAPDGLRMAYVIDGNVYFQEGSNAPIQVTHQEAYRHLIGFSEDGEKIFYYEEIPGLLYSVQVDGSNEKALISDDLLRTITTEDINPTKFCEPLLVPHSSIILFRTCTNYTQAEAYTFYYNDDLYMLDTDTNETRLLLPRGNGGSDRTPSPDGKKLAMDHIGYIDILRTDGRMISHRLATYTISEPIPLAALVFWTADSNGLILALPINKHYDTAPAPAYEVWHYSLDTGAGTKFSLDPPPSGYNPVWPSPDGKWILYSNDNERSFYLVDLSTGHSQVYEPGTWNLPCGWSPNGVHFAYTGELGTSIGSIDGPPIRLGGRGECLGWLDENRFIYLDSDHNTYVMKDLHSGESTPILAGNIWQLRAYDNLVFYPPLYK